MRAQLSRLYGHYFKKQHNSYLFVYPSPIVRFSLLVLVLLRTRGSNLILARRVLSGFSSFVRMGGGGGSWSGLLCFSFSIEESPFLTHAHAHSHRRVQPYKRVSFSFSSSYFVSFLYIGNFLLTRV